MKPNRFKYRFIFYLIVILLSTNSISQDFKAEDYGMLFNFKSIKQPDNTRLLEVSFNARSEADSKVIIPIYGAEIKFLNAVDNKDEVIGTSKTSKDGIAKFIVPENFKYLKDKEGNINIVARFEGTDAIDSEEEIITLKDVHLELELKEIDSVKTAIAKIYTLNNLGEEIPVEADFSLYVNSMFAKFKIGEGSVSDGEFEYHFEFPTDLPGDINDELTVFLMIEDHDEFGNVVQMKKAKWGMTHTHKKEKKLALWTKSAPIWMYVVLTILLVGVWANYFYTMVNLFKIKNEGDQFESRL
ncbi:MAG TPA: hypothetical protein VFY09_06330 [Flavobacteriaceae bacterium]|nr:hypothetical protein [Flavobacteriaceae bacterium]HEX5743500.1 hypothetical protein [Flavobacteriaceae bacterium]